MKTLRTPLIATAVFGMLAGIAVQANADSNTLVTAERLHDLRSVAVNIADLNLNTPEGQEALFRRISRAADEVCGPRDTRRAGDLAQAARNRACYKVSLSNALSEVSRNTVAATN